MCGLSKLGRKALIWVTLVAMIVLEYIAGMGYWTTPFYNIEIDSTLLNVSAFALPDFQGKGSEPVPFEGETSEFKVVQSKPRVLFLENATTTTTFNRKIETGIWNGNREDNHTYSNPVTGSLRQAVTLDGRDDADSCKPSAAWQSRFHPTCNFFHEVGFVLDDVQNFTNYNEEKIELLSAGTQLHSWKVTKHQDATVVLKTLPMDCDTAGDCEFSHNSYDKQMVDAVAKERLTASPNVVNGYGFCGVSVLNELGTPFRLRQRDGIATRLKYSRQLAQGMADLHGIDGPSHATLVHGNLRPSNVVVSQDGTTLKLTNFQKGRFLGWNGNANQGCGYGSVVRSHCSTAILAPEECLGEARGEHTDVYHLGGMIFFVLTGEPLYSFNSPNDLLYRDDALLKHGEWKASVLPGDIQISSEPSIVAMRTALTRCLTFKPQDRPTARQVLEILQKVYY